MLHGCCSLLFTWVCVFFFIISFSVHRNKSRLVHSLFELWLGQSYWNEWTTFTRMNIEVVFFRVHLVNFTTIRLLQFHRCCCYCWFGCRFVFHPFYDSLQVFNRLFFIMFYCWILFDCLLLICLHFYLMLHFFRRNGFWYFVNICIEFDEEENLKKKPNLIQVGPKRVGDRDHWLLIIHTRLNWSYSTNLPPHSLFLHWTKYRPMQGTKSVICWWNKTVNKNVYFLLSSLTYLFKMALIKEYIKYLNNRT